MRNVLISEWTKLRTVRPTKWFPVAAFAAVPLLAVIVALTASLQPDDTVLGGSLTGAVLGQFGAAILGVLIMSAEYSTGMIRTTFTATPSRVKVLGAKALVTASVTFTGGLTACALAYGIGLAMLSGEGYQPGRPIPALLGIAVSFVIAGLLGLAAVVILRHTAGALAAALGIILLPAMLGPILGSSANWLTTATPAIALDRLARDSSSAWPSLVIAGTCAGVALAFAAWRTQRRDA